MAIDSYLLTVIDVIQETPDARTIVFDLPEELRSTFAYDAGQFITVAVPSDQTGVAARCYSLSNAPHDDTFRITVKRHEGGYASNWIHANLAVGDQLRVLPPGGIFTPKDINADLLLLAAGSGITPLHSMAQTALEKGSGRVVMFYANRDESSVIFARELSELAQKYPDRFTLVHWLETVQGLPSQEQLKTFSSYFSDYTAFVCGPRPFMKAAMGALRELEFPRERRHQEKFASLGGNPFGDVAEVAAAAAQIAQIDDPADDADADGAISGPIEVEVELDGQRYQFDDWDGKTLLLEFLEEKDIDAPYSCREGNCAACAAVLVEGDLSMQNNNVLYDEDLADGIRLICQSQAQSKKVNISYDIDI